MQMNEIMSGSVFYEYFDNHGYLIIGQRIALAFVFFTIFEYDFEQSGKF